MFISWCKHFLYDRVQWSSARFGTKPIKIWTPFWIWKINFPMELDLRIVSVGRWVVSQTKKMKNKNFRFFSHEKFFVRKNLAEIFENLEISENSLKNQNYQRKKYFAFMKNKIFQKSKISIFKIIFFIEKIWVRKKIGYQDRCKIL